jgi:hypothetical protein
MWIVHYWTFDYNGEFFTHRKFDTKTEAERFAKAVNGTIETKPAFQ